MFLPNDSYGVMRLAFSFNMSLPAMSFGDRFCMSRKGGTGGGGWLHLKGANSMATPVLGSRKALVGTRWPITVLFGMDLETSGLTL